MRWAWLIARMEHVKNAYVGSEVFAADTMKVIVFS